MAAIKQGRKRGTGRGWRAKLYEPTDRYSYYRAVFKDGDGWVHRQSPSDDLEGSESWFESIEDGLDKQVLLVSPRSDVRPTMRMLQERYLRWLGDGGRDAVYINQVKNLLEVWVLRQDGGLYVDAWTAVHSQGWISAARRSLSPARVENLGTALSGMRKAAWRRGEDGLRWMARDEDPLEDVEYSRRSTEKGAHRDYIPPSARPNTDQVLSLIGAAEHDAAWDWMPTQLGVGSFCGPRLSEQLAVRAVDVDLEGRVLRIRNAVRWSKPSEGIALGLKATKTTERRTTPYPASLHEPLLALCRERFGLPPDATVEEVTRAQNDLYEGELRDLDDFIYRNRGAREISPNEGLLFVDRNDLPPTKEKYGEEWRRLRANSTWSNRIPWRNARHHCATWWPTVFRDQPLINEENFAAWLGHSYQTYINHYRRTGDDADTVARGVLDSH